MLTPTEILQKHQAGWMDAIKEINENEIKEEKKYLPQDFEPDNYLFKLHSIRTFTDKKGQDIVLMGFKLAAFQFEEYEPVLKRYSLEKKYQHFLARDLWALGIELETLSDLVSIIENGVPDILFYGDLFKKEGSVYWDVKNIRLFQEEEVNISNSDESDPLYDLRNVQNNTQDLDNLMT